MFIAGTKALADALNNDTPGIARHVWYAMYDAALATSAGVQILVQPVSGDE